MTVRGNLKVVMVVLLCLALLSPCMFLVWAYSRVYSRLPLVYQPYNPPLGSTILDVKGRVVSQLFQERRIYVPLEGIPPCVIHAFLAAEDRDFFTHPGFDTPALFRALVTGLFRGRMDQGGSTITQQCAKQLYAGSRRSFLRKAEELFFAREMERRFTKNQILEIYLNQIYFGHGIYGVAAAADFFFARELSTLGPVEGAVLASIPPAPSRYSPLRNCNASFERAGDILYRMAAAGWVDPAWVRTSFGPFCESYRQDLLLRSPDEVATIRSVDLAPWFTEYIRRIMLDRYGADRVYRGGLRIHTTLDLDMQGIADRYMNEGLERQRPVSARANAPGLNGLDALAVPGRETRRDGAAAVMRYLRSGPLDVLEMTGTLLSQPAAEPAERYRRRCDDLARTSRTQGALLAVDIQGCGIQAMVGGGEYGPDNMLNRAVQSRRQAGSAFKTFVYGAALEERRITPATAFMDMPMIYAEKEGDWSPSNYDKSFRGIVLARRAFALSLNVVSVQIYEAAGGGRIAGFASRLCGTSPSAFPRDPTMALGSGSMTLFEMVKGYGVIAREGRDCDPHAILLVEERNGNRLESYQAPPEKQVMDRGTAILLRDMLRQVVDGGTATRAVRQEAGLTLPAAGKTGTTSDFRDAWFVGFTPFMVAGVWMGCDEPVFVLGQDRTGSVCAAPVWAAFMKDAGRDWKGKPFSTAEAGLVRRAVCSHSGNLPGPACETIDEIFLPGTEPSQTCSGIHDTMESVSDVAQERGESR